MPVCLMHGLGYTRGVLQATGGRTWNSEMNGLESGGCRQCNVTQSGLAKHERGLTCFAHRTSSTIGHSLFDFWVWTTDVKNDIQWLWFGLTVSGNIGHLTVKGQSVSLGFFRSVERYQVAFRLPVWSVKNVPFHSSYDSRWYRGAFASSDSSSGSTPNQELVISRSRKRRK